MTMTRVEEIQSAIVSLSPQEYTRLQQWFTERSRERWDGEIEEDAASGKLDFLADEAARDKYRGRLRKL